MYVAQKNHGSWKDEAVRNTKDLEQQLAQAGVKCTQAEDEKRALGKTVEELKAQLREYDRLLRDALLHSPLLIAYIDRLFLFQA